MPISSQWRRLMPCGRPKKAKSMIGTMRWASITDLVKRVRLDLRELVLHIVRIHRTDLLPCWRPEDFDNFDQLIDA